MTQTTPAAQRQGIDKATQKALNKMTGRQLAEYVLSRTDSAARLAGLALLRDNYALRRLARDDADAEVRLLAVSRLDAENNQDVLFAAARDEEERLDVRLAAAGRLHTPQYLLHLIADTRTEAYAVETRAVMQLPFPDMVRRVALTSNCPALRSAAVSRVLDEALLTDIARHDEDFRVRETAIRYLSDEQTRAYLTQKLAEDKTIKDDTITRWCAGICASPERVRQVCAEMWEKLDDYTLPPNAFHALVASLCRALTFPVERKFDPALVSAQGTDLGGNRCAARMLAYFYLHEATPGEERAEILKRDGIIIAYIEAETRNGPMLRRVLFEPRVKTGARIAT